MNGSNPEEKYWLPTQYHLERMAAACGFNLWDQIDLDHAKDLIAMGFEPGWIVKIYEPGFKHTFWGG